MSEQTQTTTEATEKSGSGILGGAAAVGVGGLAGYHTSWNVGVKSQRVGIIENTVDKAAELVASEDKKIADYAKAVEAAGAKPVVEGEPLTHAQKLLNARAELAKTGEQALTKEAKAAATTARKEAIAGIEAGLKEAKVSTSIGYKGLGKAALIAVPTTIVTKVVLDKAFGKSNRVAEAAPEAAAAR